MDTYFVQLDSPKRSLKHKVAEALLLGGLYFALWLSWSLLWPNPYRRNSGALSIALEGGFVALFWAVSMAFVPRSSKPSYKLLVDEESITGVTEYSGWMKWFVSRKTIRKGEVRNIFEIKGRLGAPSGVGISKRGTWGTRLFGFVYLPKTLPEYEYLKRLMESWRSTE